MPEVPDSHRDLLESDVATLATIGPDGRPQLSEVWFLAEGNSIAVSLNTGRQKTKNLRARPQNPVIMDGKFTDAHTPLMSMSCMRASTS